MLDPLERRSTSSATRKSNLRASCCRKRRAKACAPGATAGRMPSPSCCSLRKSLAASRMLMFALLESLASEAILMPLLAPPCTRETILRSKSKASLSSRVRMILRDCCTFSPKRRLNGSDTGRARGPSSPSKLTTTALFTASTAATASSMRMSCKKLPFGEKRTTATSRVAASMATGAAALSVATAPSSACAWLGTSITSPGASGLPAVSASSLSPFMRLVKEPNPLVSSSIRDTAILLRPL
mmetsp:Transcript_57413/g.136461  ORF Transcript_57413/g.136461 Transcript_57413/m.136461 type:complete len:242 (-) Transcript_57413:2203-2928(-)